MSDLYSTTNIRRLAGILAFGLVGVVATLAHERPGQAWPDALGSGVGASLAGLAAWWGYHLVGRQNNGLILMTTFMFPFIQGERSPDVGATAALALFALGFGAVIGLLARVWPRRRSSNRQGR